MSLYFKLLGKEVMLNQMLCLVLMAFNRASDYALFIPSKYFLIFDAAFSLRSELR